MGACDEKIQKKKYLVHNNASGSLLLPGGLTLKLICEMESLNI